MCMQNLKSIVLPVPEIIGGTRKNWAVPGYAHAPFSQKFLMGFCASRGNNNNNNITINRYHVSPLYHATVEHIVDWVATGSLSTGLTGNGHESPLFVCGPD